MYIPSQLSILRSYIHTWPLAFLIIPFFIQIVNQSIFVVARPATSSSCPIFVADTDITSSFRIEQSSSGRQAVDAGTKDDLEHVLQRIRQRSSRANKTTTHRDKAEYASPQAVVWELTPTSLVHDIPLIDDTADQIG